MATINTIVPFVRFARKCEHGFCDKISVAPDHRIFYCIEGNAEIFIRGVKFSIIAGDIIYWPSGYEYKVFCDKNTVITGCNFDFTQNNAEYSTPISPVLDSKEICETFENLQFTDSELFNSPFVLHSAFSLKNKFLELSEEYDRKQIYYVPICSAILKGILISCVRRAETDCTGNSSKLAQEVLRFIRQNYNQNITNEMIGKHFGYHPNYLNNLVINHTGKSMHRYLLEYKINSAISYFESSDISVSEVAANVGFPDIKHFSKAFKNITGFPPSYYKHPKNIKETIL